MQRIASCVFEYIFAGEPRSFGGLQAAALVECGLARFTQTVEGIVDEPIVLLAAADFFSMDTSMQAILSAGLTSSDAAERGFAFKRFGAFLLARAFESQTESQTPQTPSGTPALSKLPTPPVSAPQIPLSSVFEFIGSTELRHESAHLVAIGRGVKNKYRCTLVKFSPSFGCNYILGQSLSSGDQTLEWLKNPKDTAFCFPDEDVGFDLILLLQLSDATVLRVLVQFEHISERLIGLVKTEDAFRMTDPLQFLSQRGYILEPEESKCVFVC
jgi:hypothetical protein